MNKHEIRTSLTIASIFAFRMLGLFMILPVFALYAGQYQGSSTQLIGLALGIYGLTQALLQLPLGTLSDRIGRKPVIAAGLVIFGIGSVIAASADSMVMLILGRALQGAGAVGSTLLALLADLTTTANRTKAMALVGALIGASFTLAMVLGPILAQWFGLHGLFWITALLAALGICMLIFAIPNPPIKEPSQRQPLTQLILDSLRNPNLLRLYLGVFCSHAMLTASFTALPIIITHTGGLAANKHWAFYLPVMISALLLMVPFLIISEKHGRSRSVFLLAIGVLGLSQLSLFSLHQNIAWIATALVLFFAAFSLLEALLPSMVSKLASSHSKGTALGIHSTSQFLGIFFGGLIAGLLQHHFPLYSVFIFNGLLAFTWLLISIKMTTSIAKPGIATTPNP